MNDNLLKDDAILEFKKFVQNAENIKRDLDCYVTLLRELIIRSYCEN